MTKIARLVDGLPFCPDHRDKVAGLPCRECEIEQLRGALGRIRDYADGKRRSVTPLYHVRREALAALGEEDGSG